MKNKLSSKNFSVLHKKVIILLIIAFVAHVADIGMTYMSFKKDPEVFYRDEVNRDFANFLYYGSFPSLNILGVFVVVFGVGLLYLLFRKYRFYHTYNALSIVLWFSIFLHLFGALSWVWMWV